MAKKEAKLAVLHDDDFKLFDENEPIIDAGLLLQNTGLNAPRIKARELVDQDFIIRYYKSFETTMNPAGYAYFAVVMIVDTGEIRTTVFGSKTVTDFLDMAKAVDPRRPIGMTLKLETSSAGREYYTIV